MNSHILLLCLVSGHGIFSLPLDVFDIVNNVVQKTGEIAQKGNEMVGSVMHTSVDIANEGKDILGEFFSAAQNEKKVSLPPMSEPKTTSNTTPKLVTKPAETKTTEMKNKAKDETLHGVTERVNPNSVSSDCGCEKRKSKINDKVEDELSTTSSPPSTPKRRKCTEKVPVVETEANKNVITTEVPDCSKGNLPTEYQTTTQPTTQISSTEISKDVTNLPAEYQTTTQPTTQISSTEISKDVTNLPAEYQTTTQPTTQISSTEISKDVTNLPAEYQTTTQPTTEISSTEISKDVTSEAADNSYITENTPNGCVNGDVSTTEVTFRPDGESSTYILIEKSDEVTDTPANKYVVDNGVILPDRKILTIHDFNTNYTLLLHKTMKYCGVMTLDQEKYKEPLSEEDLLTKLTEGYYDVDFSTILWQMKVVYPAVKDLNPFGDYIEEKCDKLTTYRLEKKYSRR